MTQQPYYMHKNQNFLACPTDLFSEPIIFLVVRSTDVTNIYKHV